MSRRANTRSQRQQTFWILDFGFWIGERFNPKSAIRNPQSGIALLIVVSMLTVIGIMGVAFAFSMFLETQEGRQFVSTNQARYLA